MIRLFAVASTRPLVKQAEGILELLAWLARSRASAAGNLAWARLIRKVYEADPLECPKCDTPQLAAGSFIRGIGATFSNHPTKSSTLESQLFWSATVWRSGFVPVPPALTASPRARNQSSAVSAMATTD